MKGRSRSSLHSVLALVAVVSLFCAMFQPGRVLAAGVLTVTPITWNVIGLDSNNVNVGPNHFPVGVRVCNTGDSPATNLSAVFTWDSANTYINNRPGTDTTLTLASLSNVSPDNCADFYFEVEVDRNPAAYDTTRRYHITVTADGGISVSTPTPRELYVEHLISQSRNGVDDVQLSTDGTTYTSVPSGGSMTLMVGNTYWIKMVGFTATNGYNQLESFINLPNTVFQVLSVASVYTAGTSPTSTLYADSCTWDSDPNSPTYRSCVGADDKSGGDIAVTYQVKILSVPATPLTNPEPLTNLIYDFSGSSYHYNSDHSRSVRYANVVSATLTKAFSPKTIAPQGPSTVTFVITNPGPVALAAVNFTDPFPSGLAVSSAPSPTIDYSGCGDSPSPSTLSGGETSISFSGIGVAGYGTCTITVSYVTASAAGSYLNTTTHLLIGTTDTGSYGSDTLVVSTQPPPPSTCTTPSTLATWNMPTSGQGSGGPPPPYTTKATDVATASASSSGGTPSFVAGVTTNAWQILGGWNGIPPTPTSASTPYFDFLVDTSNYGGVSIQFAYDIEDPGDWTSQDQIIYVYSRPDSGSYTAGTPYTALKASWQSGAAAVTHPAASTGISSTNFRINVFGCPANKPNCKVALDDIVISGCPRLEVPTLSKAFSPTSIVQGAASTLTFTFANPNGSALTGVGFADTLPSGLVINDPNDVSSSCSAGAMSGQTITATPGSSSISLSGATLSANASCTISVSVKGNVAGQYHNISDNITSTETGPNTTSTGYGTADLTVIAPPVISKVFGSTDILTGDSTSLSFSISNPNLSTTLTGVAFTDDLPSGLVVATPSNLSSTCSGTTTADAASSTVSLSGASLLANASCTISLNVTGTTAGVKNNSVTVTSTNGGTGNTATAVLLVRDVTPEISLLKQVGPSASGPWTSYLAVTAGSNVYYKFTIENTGDVPLNPVNVTDPTLASTPVDPATCSWTNPLPVASPTQDPTETCVVGPVTALSGSHPNTATSHGTYNSTVYDSIPSTARYATTELTLVKSVTESAFTAAGNVLHYSYVVTNSGSASLAGPVTVSDDKATDETCPSVTTVGDLDLFLEPGESITCSATYAVTAGDVTAGFVTNVASATAGGVTSNTDSRTVPGPGSIMAHKFYDLDKDGSQDTGEPNVNNWNFSLYTGSCSTGTLVETRTTGTDGSIIFTYAPGDYYVEETPGAWTATTGTCQNVTLETGEAQTVNFGNYQANWGSLPDSYDTTMVENGPHHVLYPDTNADGSPNSVYGHDAIWLGPAVSAQTDGTPGFPPPSRDGVTLTNPTEWFEGSAGGTIDVALNSSGLDEGRSAWLVVWFDWNYDGVFQASEAAVNTLVSWNGPSASQQFTFDIPTGGLAGSEGNTTLYYRARLFDTGTAPDPGTAFAGLFTNGEVEDYEAPISMLPVTLSYFEARARGKTVHFEWSTSTEAGNAGFNLYALTANGREKLNARMIRSGASSSLQPQDYTYQVETKANTFYLEEVSVLGERQTYGPFEIGEQAGKRAERAAIDWAGINAEHQSKQTARKAAQAVQITKALDALRVASAPPAAATFAPYCNLCQHFYLPLIMRNVEPLPPNVASIRIAELRVNESGIYRVTYEALLRAGLDLSNVAAADLALTVRGQPVPLRVTGSDQFGPGSFVEFYGEALDTLYTDTNVYVLWSDHGKARRVAIDGSAPDISGGLPAFYMETARVNQQKVYSFAAPGVDPWYDADVWSDPGVTTHRDFSIELEGYTDSTAPSALAVTLWGPADYPANPDHHVVVEFNGQSVADFWFDGLASHEVQAALPAGLAHTGANTLRITMPGDVPPGVEWNWALLDRYSVTYPRSFAARNGRLTFAAQDAAFQVTGLPAGESVAYRIEGDAVTFLAGTQAAGGTATVPGAASEATYAVAAASSLLSPQIQPATIPADLLAGPAQYLVIAHPDFLDGLAPLVQARQAQGFSVKVANVQDIYAQYSGGVLDPNAIRSYVAQAADTLGTQYVLLVGGDTYDYRNYLGLNSTSFIPSLYTATDAIVRFAPVDPLYADIDGNNVPDLAIGRLPVRTDAELATIISKTLAYASKTYGKTSVFAAEAGFQSDSTAFIGTLPAGWDVRKAYISEVGVAAARTELLAALNNGVALASFVGHSGPDQWTYAGLFDTIDAANLTNQGKPSVVTQWGCWNTYYVDPTSDTLGHALMLSGENGSAAVLGATTLTLAASERSLGQALTPRLTQPGMTVGAAIQAAKTEIASQQSGLQDVLLGWSLLGDPALVIAP